MSSCPSPLYRLRPYSPVALKELLYGEVYFSSLQELADPYDTKVYYRFRGDQGRYERLIATAVTDLLPAGTKIDLSPLASQLCGSDLSYEKLIEKIAAQPFYISLLTELIRIGIPEAVVLASFMIRRLKHEIHKHVGRHAYVVSFSSGITDPMLWSLHAGNHSGYAIRILPVNNSLLQHPLQRAIAAKLEDGTMQYREGLVFEFKEVRYVNQILPLNGFYNFNGEIYGENVPENSVNDFWQRYELVTTTKYLKWEFEKEYRLVDTSDWMPDVVTEDGAQQRKSADRIFHYDQTQLDGIIFGMNMPREHREELVRTVEVMRDRLFHYCNGCLPLLLFYQATQNHSAYRIDNEPVFGLDMNNRWFDISQTDNKRREFKQALDFLRKKNKMPGFAGLSVAGETEST